MWQVSKIINLKVKHRMNKFYRDSVFNYSRASFLSIRAIYRNVGPVRSFLYFKKWVTYVYIVKLLFEKHNVSDINIDGKGSHTKFLDYKYWILRNLSRFSCLEKYFGQQSLKKLRVFDIGCGVGYQSIVCNGFGVYYSGCDVPTSSDSVYTLIPPLFNVDKHIFTVDELSIMPANFLRTYSDRPILITCFMVCFNRVSENEIWGVFQWRKFLDTMLSLPFSEINVWFEFNKQEENRYLSDELISLFESYGFQHLGNGIVFLKNQAHRRPNLKTDPKI